MADKIKMYDPKREYNLHKEDINQSIQKVLDHGIYIGGPEVSSLEKRLSEYVDVTHCITVSNGTDALTLALLALDVKQGDEVITVPFTWISSAEIISLIGAIPVFCDIDNKTYTLDADKMESLITDKTKAIICVNIFGHSCDFKKINEIANKHNIKVIEDAAQSFGSEYNGKKSCSLSHIGTTSFFPSKPLGCYGDGGAVFTNDTDLNNKIRALKNHGCLVRYQHKYIGFNARLDSIQAAVLNVKLDYFDETVNNRINCAKYYNDHLSKCENIVLPYIDEGNKSAYAQYALLANNKMERDNIVEFLRENNIAVEIFYPVPLHVQECFGYLKYNKGDFPVCEEISDRVFNLPCYGELTENEQKYICDTLLSYFN
jgi:UDP-2-acetamido-2-deoxy-ribo-hexuluronate aminotransferase